ETARRSPAEGSAALLVPTALRLVEPGERFPAGLLDGAPAQERRGGGDAGELGARLVPAGLGQREDAGDVDLGIALRRDLPAERRHRVRPADRAERGDQALALRRTHLLVVEPRGEPWHGGEVPRADEHAQQ